MPKEAIQTDSENGSLDPLEIERLKDQVLELSNRISALAKGPHGAIEDLALAQEMAQAAKPYIDRLIALHRLLNPIDLLVAKREQVQQFQSEVAADIAEIEDLASDFGTEIDEGLFNDLQGEIAAVKKDCKFIRQPGRRCR